MPPVDLLVEVGDLVVELPQQVARTGHHARRLLFLALDHDEAHVRALHSLEDRVGIGRVVLLSLDERLYINGREQPHFMPDR